jgi:hypothetical protein
MTRITLANILVCLAVGAWLGWTFTVALGQTGGW